MLSYFGQIQSQYIYMKLALEKVFTRDVIYVLSCPYLLYFEDCHSGLLGRQPLDCLLFQQRIQRVPGNRMPLKRYITSMESIFLTALKLLSFCFLRSNHYLLTVFILLHCILGLIGAQESAFDMFVEAEGWLRCR